MSKEVRYFLSATSSCRFACVCTDPFPLPDTPRLDSHHGEPKRGAGPAPSRIRAKMNLKVPRFAGTLQQVVV